MILSGSAEGEQAAAESEAGLAGRLVVDPRPKNTFENALFSKELAKPKPGRRWTLATSATHVPRAMGAFRTFGLALGV